MSKETSKLLSLVLRHEPGRIGIGLDENGWTAIDVLLVKLGEAGTTIDRDLLQNIVDANDKKRFTISEDGLRIRAAQGHSVDVDLGLSPSEPPATLYHGTAAGNLESISKTGLRSGQRQHVHLSADRATAARVGQRHGRPIVFSVNTAEMQRDGHKFIQAENGVWLTDLVPANYLKLLE